MSMIMFVLPISASISSIVNYELSPLSLKFYLLIHHVDVVRSQIVSVNESGSRVLPIRSIHGLIMAAMNSKGIGVALN